MTMMEYVYVRTLSELKALPEQPANVTILLDSTTEDDDVCFRPLGILGCPNVKKVDFTFGAAVFVAKSRGHTIKNDRDNISHLLAIINKHLQGDRDVLLCQDELIDAGFAEIARL